MKYNTESDKILKDLYDSVGAKTWEQKFHALELKLQIVPGSQSFSHNPTWRQKVGTLEYELLERMGALTLVYC